MNTTRRMCWAVPLLCLQEAAQDKIEEAAASYAKSGDGDVLSRTGIEEGSISQELANKKRSAFMNVLAINESWVQEVVADALSYSKTAAPRDRERVNRILNGTNSPGKSPRDSPVQSSLSAKFNEDVWPTLRSRGWKDDQKTGGKGICYSFKGMSHTSIVSVLNAIPKYHPELLPMVNALISSVQALCKEEDTTSITVEFDPKNITADSLKEFLMLFAPLQLINDWRKTNRINLHHNTMVGRMSLLRALHSVVKSADKDLPPDATSKTRNEALSRLVNVSSISSRPHPQWTRLHDAILLRAVTKHGWLDRQSSVTAILNDNTIRWGAPFEPSTDKSSEAEQKQDDDEHPSNSKYMKVLSVARRAVSYIKNLKDDMVEDISSTYLNELREKLAKTYCLSPQDEEGEEDWKVDEDHLKKLIVSDLLTNEDCDELPNKKLLTKRLKKIGSALISKTIETTEEVDDPKQDDFDTSGGSNYGFVLIDQSERSNALLAEMIRSLLKLPRKSNKQREFAQLIMNEIDSLTIDMANSGEIGSSLTSLDKLKEHMVLFNSNFKAALRPSKNVLR